MEKEDSQKKRREIEFSIGPLHMTIRGYDVILSFILAGLVGFAVYFYKSDQALAQDHKVIMEKVQKAEDSLSEMAYILTLSPEKREQLNLQMPDSLRKKIKNDAR